jgi:cardiolipin synthase A/B
VTERPPVEETGAESSWCPEVGSLSELSEGELERATGSAVTRGNVVRLQFEGSTTFERWIEVIQAAERFVHFENYVFRDDAIGRRFRDVLVSKAREGVAVRVVYDWVGCWAMPRRYWKPFREAGAEVRAFKRPSVRDPYGVLQRDHRKLVAVDGRVAFVGGFCIGQEWAGTRTAPPWRDTGLEIRGPAAATAACAFERIWDVMGDPVPEHCGGRPEATDVVGKTPVWLIEGEPGRTRVLRTLMLIASKVTQHLWITDPYFVAPRAIAQALAAAARQGVDVRVLLPANNNWPLVSSISRSGYRFLLENGVRLFEWEGPMIHAKTSVADGIWSRVGSSNLNSASLLGNWEIDVGVMDASLAGQLEGLFLADLASSVEIVLPGIRGRSTAVTGPHRIEAPRQSPLDPEDPLSSRTLAAMREQTSGRRWHLAQLLRAGTSFSGAIAGHRTLGREERSVLGTVSILLLVAALLLVLLPKIVAWTAAAGLGWLGLVTAVRALAHRRRAQKLGRMLEEGTEETRMEP